MELIDRYIYAIGKHLPYNKKTDIQTELRSTLLDTLEARDGNSPTKEQVIALLKEFGPPERVAASYWPEGQFLIGPRLFPLFRFSAGIAIVVFTIVQLVLAGILVLTNQDAVPGLEFFGNLFNSVMIAFGTIVLVFAVLQRFDVRPSLETEEWNPKDLPVVEESNEIKRGEIITELIFELIFASILVIFPAQIGAVLYPGSEIIINPPLLTYLPLIIISLLLGIGLDVILLWRGRWEIGSRLAKIAIDLFGIGVLFLLITSHTAWLAENGVSGFFSAFTLLGNGAPTPETIQIMVVSAFRLGFIVAFIVSVIELVNSVYRLVKPLFQPVTIKLPK